MMPQRDGFTLAELVVVLAIASVLGAMFMLGCSAVQKPGTGAALPREPLELEADADPSDALPPFALEPVPLMTSPPPTYRRVPVPARPKAVGRLDVPLGRQWRHIVVHHSFTGAGSMESFDRYHKQKGWLGVGYHFVIGNGHGSPDGATEVTFRWERQIHGAHAGVREYNEHGIGICLVGDFQNGYPTEKQIASLVSLVNYLQERCHIPTSNIWLHRQLKTTLCPGKNFPFYEFISLLEH
jgi:prepilin-type N-terminal cleavage/methylation domain-containing protein